MAAADPVIDPTQWTAYEDGAICAFKADNKSWNEIVTEIDRHKKHVQRRYGHLVQTLGADGVAKLAEGWKAGKEKGKSTQDTGSGQPENNVTAHTAEQVERAQRSALSPRSVPSSSPSSSSSSTSPSSSSCSSSSEDSPAALDDRSWDHVYSAQYPVQSIPHPDGLWSEADCRILAISAARYDALKWLQMQADFFNATGRMVDLALIRYKMEEEEEEERGGEEEVSNEDSEDESVSVGVSESESESDDESD